MPYVKTVTVRVNASPERVFDVLSDVERYPLWVPNMIRVERADTGAIRVGSRWTETVKTLKADNSVDSTDQLELVVLDRPRRWTVRDLLKQPNAKLSAISTAFVLTEDAGATRIDATLTIDYGAPGFWGYFGRFMERLSGPAMSRILVEKLEGLNRVMDV